MKNSGSFHISAENIDCGYSLEPPLPTIYGVFLSFFFFFFFFFGGGGGGGGVVGGGGGLSRNKKTNVYPRKPQFYYIKVGFKGIKTI